MKVHEIKIAPCYFQQIIQGFIWFGIHRDDCFFNEGDRLLLREWENGKYTGRKVLCNVVYIFENLKDIKDDHYLFQIHVSRKNDN